jgi:hypothetical protein
MNYERVAHQRAIYRVAKGWWRVLDTFSGADAFDNEDRCFTHDEAVLAAMLDALAAE